MKKRSMKVLAGTLTMALAVSLAPAPGAQAAKKVSMSKKLTVVAGKSKKLKLKNNKKKVKWKVTSGKKVIALKAKKKTGVTIVGKKKGNAKVQAKIGKKTYTCKVKVKAAAKKPGKTTKPVVKPTVAPTLAPTQKPTVAPTLAPTASPTPTATPTGTPAVEDKNYNEEDVKQLNALIAELRAANATVSEDLNDENQYGWDENGYLSEIDWSSEIGAVLSGDIKVPAFPNLTYLDVSDTDITGLDCTACTKLEYLDCSGSSSLANLNVSTCAELEELYCEETALTEIDLTNCLSLTADNITYPEGAKIIGWEDASPEELSALVRIVDEQLANGASPDISVRDETGNLREELYTNEDRYTWNEQGHLTWLTLDNVGLNGDLSLTEFPYLEGIDVSMNELTSLDLTGCSRLESLWCYDNALTSLKLTECSALIDLDCSNNQLLTLDLSPCKELDLEEVNYEGNEGITVTTEDNTGDDFGI